ncbi:uncharacterized protein LOC130775320 isoform X2 [Actinidia eriantha]|uniref:uncharacterized protein LOC130775320 isoform X2 n=1 Tax=Actinidia eriantha TaxID=165200 RepID=UPI00258A5B4E|nr:uncharacterized protein LOC130775320 isoform X2 [Actinidia eriantha]
MPIFTAAIGSVSGIAFLSHLLTSDPTSLSHHHHQSSSSSSSSVSSLTNPSFNFPNCCWNSAVRRHPFHAVKVSVSGDAEIEAPNGAIEDSSVSPENVRQARRSADWEAARAYSERGLIYQGKIEGCNGGGLIIRFYSIYGFLPYPQLSPYHSCKEPNKTIQEIAEALIGSLISVKIIQADQGNRKLIFSEKEAMWSKFSQQINVGDIFQGQVGSVEDYGAFVHLRFPDGSYHLTGLVHVSEVSWDLIQDVRDVLSEGEEVRVKVIKIDREKSRLTLSIKQLEEDPLLETLEKVMPQDGSVDFSSSGTNTTYDIQPLPGLEAILEELLKEEGLQPLANSSLSSLVLEDRCRKYNLQHHLIRKELKRHCSEYWNVSRELGVRFHSAAIIHI